MKNKFIYDLTIQSLKEQREIQQLTEQLDVIRNLENNPQVAKYISSIADHLQNVPLDKKLDIIANFLTSLGVDDEFEGMKNRISTKFNQEDREEDEMEKEIGDVNKMISPVDVKPALEEMILKALKEARK